MIYFTGTVKKGDVFVENLIKTAQTHSEEETQFIAAEFAKTLKNGDFIAFFGDLGAGKTAFVRGMASVLTPGADVCSPTYAIVNEYHSDTAALIHFDMYRINDDDSLYMTGYYDYFDRYSQKKCVYAVEWSENIPFALPDCYYKISVSKSDGDTRNIDIYMIERE